MKNEGKHRKMLYTLTVEKTRLIQIKEGERTAKKTITEEHVVLLSEPGSKYVGHVTPISSNSHSIKTIILNFLEKNVDISKLKAIGCDGTMVNTGSKN